MKSTPPLPQIVIKMVLKKILNIYRSEADETVKKLVAIVNRDREREDFDLTVENPDYDALVDKIFAADQTICWW